MIILDGPNLTYRAHSANPGPSWNGMATGALHTGLTMLAALPRVIERQQLVVAWDGRNSWRKQILPEYKANRVANEEARAAFVEGYLACRLEQGHKFDDYAISVLGSRRPCLALP